MDLDPPKINGIAFKKIGKIDVEGSNLVQILSFFGFLKNMHFFRPWRMSDGFPLPIQVTMTNFVAIMKPQSYVAVIGA